MYVYAFDVVSNFMYFDLFQIITNIINSLQNCVFLHCPNYFPGARGSRTMRCLFNSLIIITIISMFIIITIVVIISVTLILVLITLLLSLLLLVVVVATSSYFQSCSNFMFEFRLGIVGLHLNLV